MSWIKQQQQSQQKVFTRRLAILDLSPYWRPPEWALAVVVVDALVWADAPPALADDHAEALKAEKGRDIESPPKARLGDAGR